jgi:hypothetical protein
VVKENQGPANEQTRARVNAKKNQCSFRTWAVKAGDLRIKVGDRVLYKSVELKDPEDELPPVTLHEGSLVHVFGKAARQRVWALGHVVNGSRLILFVAGENEVEPYRTSIFEVTKILPDEPSRPAGANKWLAEEADRSRERKKGQKMAMARSRANKSRLVPAQGAGPDDRSYQWLKGENERLRSELARERQLVEKLREKIDELSASWIKGITELANKAISSPRQL